MNIKHSIGLNLSADAISPRLYMVQGDANSRTIVATLWDGAQLYSIPAGAAIMVRFRKPDGTGGLYDATESGSKVAYVGSIVTAPVATQMLAVAGDVFTEIDIFGSSSGAAAERLATFRFVVEVAPCVYPDAEIISSSYYNVLTGDIAAAKTAATNAQNSATAAAASAESASASVVGAVKYNVKQTLTAAQKEQAQENIGVTWSCGENLLINADFRPVARVNQRGSSIYTGGVYGLDGWKGGDYTKVTLASFGLNIQPTDSAQQAIYKQLLEYPSRLLGQTVTLSAILSTGALYTATSTLPETLPAEMTGYCAIDGVLDLLSQGGDSGLLYVRLKGAAPGGARSFRAAKLELGGVQTLAHQDTDGNWVLNETGDYARTLQQCQRYLLPLASDLVAASLIGTGIIYFFVPLPVTMRAKPSIAVNNFKVRSATGVDQTGFTFTAEAVRANGVMICATKANHGLTNAMLNAGSVSLLSAEL